MSLDVLVGMHAASLVLAGVLIVAQVALWMSGYEISLFAQFLVSFIIMTLVCFLLFVHGYTSHAHDTADHYHFKFSQEEVEHE